MKIIETEDDILKIYSDGDDIWLEFEYESYCLSPLEAMALSDALTRVYKNSAYFQGLRLKD